MVGYVFQDYNLIPSLTAAENVALPLELDRVRTREAVRQARAALDEVGLAGLYDRFPDDLSGGQQQRIAIARAVYGDPFMVLLDEPSASLDGEGEAALQSTIKQLKLRRAIVIQVVHRRSALELCDKVLVLLNGQQRDFGPRDEVLRRMSAPPPVAQPAGANLKVVGEPSKEERR
jgi:putative ABC transport system ATP-binding protein